MSLPVKTESFSSLSEGRKDALLKLLTDDDPLVYRTVREKILGFGDFALDWLQPHLLSSDYILRRRARDICTVLGRKNGDMQFLAFCLKQGEDFDVEEGVWRLARTEFPEINVTAYRALLDGFAGDIGERLIGVGAADKILTGINHYLFGELKFAGNEVNYYDLENSYMNRVLDRRTGNPISLSLLYLFLARRMGLPITGIALPGHFICRYQSSTDEIFIDPFNGGKLLTKGDCIKYLIHTNHTLQEGYLGPVSARRILLRICANLHQIYTELAQPEQISRLERYLVALAK